MHPAIQYLNALFKPTDILCLTFIHATKKYASGGAVTANFFWPLAEATADSRISELLRVNDEYHIYVSMAPFKKEAGNRTKANISEVRHVFIEADENGDAVLAAVRAASADGDIPAPTIIVQSSPHKYQFIWNVEGFTIPEQEAMNRTLQQKFGGDPQAVDAARVLRIPGFRNIKPKYDDPKPVVEIIESNEPPLLGITKHAFAIPMTSEPDNTVYPVASDAVVQSSIDLLEAAMNAASVSYTRKIWEGSGGAYKFPLALCPWRENHTNGGVSDAMAIVQPSGAFGFKCLHANCANRKWDDFRVHLQSLVGHTIPFTLHEEAKPSIKDSPAPPEARRKPAESKPPVGDYPKIGSGLREPRSGKDMHPLLARARAESLKYDKEQLVFNPTHPQKAVVPIIEGFLVEGDSALFVGAKKSEKSLFSLRLSMHVACGKSWYGHKGSRPRKVAYLDAENGGPTIGSRYEALLPEFSVDDQMLISANLKIINGLQWRDAGGSLDALDDYFWDWYAKKTADAEVHILDCLYMFHTLEPKDSGGMVDVLTVLRMRLQNELKNRTVIILNHTRSFSNDDLKKSSSMSLERLGSIGFSEQSFGTKSLLKYMTVVGCLDKQFKRDEDGVITAEEVHFQFYGREISSGESILMKFEPVDEGYARRLIRTLSAGAKSAAVELRLACGEHGAWSSKHAAAKDIRKSSRSSAYRQLTELIVKEYLVADAEGALQLQISPDLAREISIAEEKNESVNAARDWLRGYVTQPMKTENVISIGDEEGHKREDLIAARELAGLVEYEQPGVDTSMVGTTMWRPKKKPGHQKGSEAAKKAAQKRWAKGDDAEDQAEDQADFPATETDIDVR